MSTIVDALAQQFHLSPAQVEGAAGSLFKFAQQHAEGTAFQQLIAAAPQIAEWLNKAPDSGHAGGGLLGGLLGGLAGESGAAGAAALVATLEKSGLNAQTIAQFVPALLQQLSKHVDPALLNQVIASVPALKTLTEGGAAGGLGGVLGGLLGGQ
ncbi:DUF2780 domain-containing protein [Solimonas marina]|uniref:DUF2780 domain-containing protein n=1 Tax=Solimonas marina TaxID=2714601 RepID=A0A969WAC3_9GAMM|nr:DUF2780 domain-containing protein [Solimonas marina]NKF22368.1 hypothetical protein [Solimonas marina]